MIPMRRRRAAGFSLIEILVVVALLAVLAAIGTGAYMRVRTGQQVKGTEETVSKASSGFMQIWSAELDNARDSFAGKSGFGQYAGQVDNAKTIAGGDVDRAKAIWTYLWMFNAFPQTVAQATAATSMTVTVSGTPVTVALAARPTFAGMVAGTLTAPEQSAVLLFRIMTQKGSRGQVFNEEAIGALSNVLAGSTYRAFTDSFGNPIAYVAMSSGIQNDANGAEYQKGTNPSRDPFDPQGRLLPANWTNATVRQAAATALGRIITPTPAPPVYDFVNENWLPTLVSRGLEPNWDPTFLIPTAKVPALPASYFRFEPIPAGYTCGYKLRRQGNRGDK